jgi:hypothetical protein
MKIRSCCKWSKLKELREIKIHQQLRAIYGEVDRTTGLEETPTKEDLDLTQRTRLASLA